MCVCAPLPHCKAPRPPLPLLLPLPPPASGRLDCKPPAPPCCKATHTHSPRMLQSSTRRHTAKHPLPPPPPIRRQAGSCASANANAVFLHVLRGRKAFPKCCTHVPKPAPRGSLCTLQRSKPLQSPPPSTPNCGHWRVVTGNCTCSDARWTLLIIASCSLGLSLGAEYRLTWGAENWTGPLLVPSVEWKLESSFTNAMNNRHGLLPARRP